MKNIKTMAISRRLITIGITAIIGFTLVACPTDGGNDYSPPRKRSANVYALNISKDTNTGWDCLVVGTDGSSMVFKVDTSTGMPTLAYLQPHKDSDAGFTMLFKENGLPDKMAANGHILLFENFDGYTFDLAVMYPNGTTEYHFGIETDVNWNAFNAGSASSGARSIFRGARSVLTDGGSASDVLDEMFTLDHTAEALDLFGKAIGVGTCIAGIFFPPALIGCGLFAAGEIANATVDYFADGWEADLGHIAVDAAGCATLDPVDCLQALVGTLSMYYDLDDKELAKVEAKLKEELEKMGPVIGEVKVTFHLNGGSGTVPPEQTITTTNGVGSVKLPSGDGLSRNGYTFTGWNNSPVYMETNWADPTPIRRNTSFYAMWKQILPGVPTGVSARAASSDSITVSWNSVSGASGYNVYRGKSALGVYDKVGSPSSAFYIDNELSANTTYYYKVSYREPGGESAQSASVYVKTMAVNAGTPVTFTELTANGYVLTTTTALTLTFSAAIPGLSAADITLFGIDGVQKGTLSGSGPEYTLGVSGFSEGGTLSVSVLKAGYNISGSLKSTTVHYREQGKGIGAYEMVFVEGGTFLLGKNLGTVYFSDETYVSSVTVSSFYIGKYEVTQSQWQAIMGRSQQQQQALQTTVTTNYGRGDAYPVYFVEWLEVLAFCNKLSMNEGLTPAYRIANSTNPIDWAQGTTWEAVTIDSGSTGYRLPTAEQWEYAAKGGNPLAPGWVGYTFAGSDNPDDVAWYSDNSEGRTHEVGTKAPNFLGLYDMSGNVYELLPRKSSSSGSSGAARGGGFNSNIQNTRILAGMYGTMNQRNREYGLRLARPAE